MDLSGCCSYCRRIMVDWEDRGLVDLLDMDRVVCSWNGTEEIIDIRNCIDCSSAVIESEENNVEEYDQHEALRDTILGYLGGRDDK